MLLICIHSTDVDTDQVGFHVQYSKGSNPGDPDCTSGLQTRVIFVCNKDAKWENEDITYYLEIERETCVVSLQFFFGYWYEHPCQIYHAISVPSIPFPLQYNIIAKYDGACYDAPDINGRSIERTSYIGWIFIGM